MARTVTGDESDKLLWVNAPADPLSDATSESRFIKYLTRVPKHGSTVDTVANIMREAILDGVLQSSEWLREKELARELSVSRTPVREAFRRLASEGFVVIAANQGAMVAPMTIEDILEVYAVRENLEGLAARLAAKNRTIEDVGSIKVALEQMRQAVADGRVSELAHLNLVFHRAIREASKNRLLGRFLGQVEHGIRRFGDTTLRLSGRAEETLEEHNRIAEAIAAEDTEAAERFSIDHMRRARTLRTSMLLDR